MTLIALDHVTHASLKYQPLDDYSFAAATNLVPLLAFEGVAAARHFPVIFPLNGTPDPHVLLGLGNRNEFVDAEGRWAGGYLPLTLANHPFSLFMPRAKKDAAPADNGTQTDGIAVDSLHEAVVVIENNAPHFQQAEGEALYSPDGSPSNTLERIAAVLGAQHQRHKQMVHALIDLSFSGVLKEKALTVTRGEESRSIAGLRVADREAVMNLPDATLARWARNGLLELLYAHWRSLDHIPALLDLLERSQQAEAVRQ